MLLETARLRLRDMSLEDATFLHELMNEPEFITNVADRGIRSTSDAETYIAKKILPSYARHGFGFYTVELKETRASVGICGLIKRDSLEDVDIGFATLRRYSGKGYTYEAAAALFIYGHEAFGLERIIGLTSPANTVSIHLLQKLGLKYERMVQLPEFERPSMLFR